MPQPLASTSQLQVDAAVFVVDQRDPAAMTGNTGIDPLFENLLYLGGHRILHQGREVGVVDYEAAAANIVDEIHLAALHVHERELIDE